MPVQVLTPETAEQIRRRHADGESARSLATEFKVSTSLIYRVIHGKWRVKVRRGGTPKITPADLIEIRRRILSGELKRTLAAEYGVTITTMSRRTRGVNRPRPEPKPRPDTKPQPPRTTPDQVLEIRRRVVQNCESSTVVARDLGFDRSHVGRVASGKLHADVGGPIRAGRALLPGDPVWSGAVAQDVGELSPDRLWQIYCQWLCCWKVPRIAQVYGLSEPLVRRLNYVWARNPASHPSKPKPTCAKLA